MKIKILITLREYTSLNVNLNFISWLRFYSIRTMISYQCTKLQSIAKCSLENEHFYHKIVCLQNDLKTSFMNVRQENNKI